MADYNAYVGLIFSAVSTRLNEAAASNGQSINLLDSFMPSNIDVEEGRVNVVVDDNGVITRIFEQ